MTGAAGFLAAIYAGDLYVCGPFADWLEERGDPRGVLLRRRWRRWQTTRARAEELERQARDVAEAPLRDLKAVVEANGGVMDYCVLVDSGLVGRVDAALLRYVAERFDDLE